MLLLESLILNEHYEKKEKRLLVGGGEPPEKVHEEPKAGILSLEIGNIVHAGPKSHITQYVLSLIIYIYIYFLLERDRPSLEPGTRPDQSEPIPAFLHISFYLFF